MQKCPYRSNWDAGIHGAGDWLTGQNADKIITVRREPEEVFSSAALASFEGKPATNDHPPDLIGPDDVAYMKKAMPKTSGEG